MSTRSLILVVLNNQYKIAQYCHSDGYPGSQGSDILSFLKTDLLLEDFKNKVNLCSFMSPEERKNLFVACGASLESNYVSDEVNDRFNSKYPYLHMDFGSRILKAVQNSENGLILSDKLKFAAESLYCEWAYVIDLDRYTFEVFKGFNQTPLTEKERFFFLSTEAYVERRGQDQYYPVKLVKSYHLFELPASDTFIKECDPPDPEDD